MGENCVYRAVFFTLALNGLPVLFFRDNQFSNLAKQGNRLEAPLTRDITLVCRCEHPDKLVEWFS